MKLSPKRRYRASLYVGFALLFILGAFLHYAANRKQRRAYETRLDRLEKELSLVRDLARASDKGGQGGNAPLAQSASQDVNLHLPPRILGNGKSGPFFWTDIQFEDGFSGRYYVRTNPTPAQVRSYVSRLAYDARIHRLDYDSGY